MTAVLWSAGLAKGWVPAEDGPCTHAVARHIGACDAPLQHVVRAVRALVDQQEAALQTAPLECRGHLPAEGSATFSEYREALAAVGGRLNAGIYTTQEAVEVQLQELGSTVLRMLCDTEHHTLRSERSLVLSSKRVLTPPGGQQHTPALLRYHANRTLVLKVDACLPAIFEQCDVPARILSVRPAKRLRGGEPVPTVPRGAWLRLVDRCILLDTQGDFCTPRKTSGGAEVDPLLQTANGTHIANPAEATLDAVRTRLRSGAYTHPVQIELAVHRAVDAALLRAAFAATFLQADRAVAIRIGEAGTALKAALARMIAGEAVLSEGLSVATLMKAFAAKPTAPWVQKCLVAAGGVRALCIEQRAIDLKRPSEDPVAELLTVVGLKLRHGLFCSEAEFSNELLRGLREMHVPGSDKEARLRTVLALVPAHLAANELSYQ